jgi:hypothetical protein
MSRSMPSESITAVDAEISLSHIVNDHHCVNLKKVIGVGQRGHAY